MTADQDFFEEPEDWQAYSLLAQNPRPHMPSPPHNSKVHRTVQTKGWLGTLCKLEPIGPGESGAKPYSPSGPSKQKIDFKRTY